MFGLDERIAALTTGNALIVAMVVAVMLGLRHATDPDHLAAVTTLAASERERSSRRAARMGLAWGLGHATTLFIFGLPIVLFQQYLPESFTQADEVLIGVLTWLWRFGCSCAGAAATSGRAATNRTIIGPSQLGRSGVRTASA